MEILCELFCHCFRVTARDTVICVLMRAQHHAGPGICSRDDDNDDDDDDGDLAYDDGLAEWR